MAAVQSFNLTIVIPTEDYEEPESIKTEGQGSFKFEEKMSGKKRKAESFEKDLPQQPTKYYATNIINSK